MEDFDFKVGSTKHSIQLSFDIMNIGNLFNSSWGVQKTAAQASNNCRVLKFEGVNPAGQPTYSMALNANKEIPTQTITTTIINAGRCRLASNTSSSKNPIKEIQTHS